MDSRRGQIVVELIETEDQRSEVQKTKKPRNPDNKPRKAKTQTELLNTDFQRLSGQSRRQRDTCQQSLTSIGRVIFRLINHSSSSCAENGCFIVTRSPRLSATVVGNPRQAVPSGVLVLAASIASFRFVPVFVASVTLQTSPRRSSTIKHRS